MAVAGLTHADWFERVPGLVEACRAEWGLALGEPYPSGAGGYVVPAELPSGEAAVLKLVFPHRESEHEADALELLGGEGAVGLLARDDERSALLIERCEPGTPLSAAGSETALDVLVALLPRLWRPAGEPFHTLVDEATWWVSYLEPKWEDAGRPYERRLLDAALEALTTLPSTQGELVLVSQDLHGNNVLAAGREPWLAIDPKPLLAEREFAIAPIVRSRELGHSRREALYRLDRLTSELGLDRERARGWTVGQTIAWTSGPHAASHLDTVRWLLDA